MGLRLFSFLKGYVIIRVSGFSVERFINLAMNRNILLTDIQYKDSYVLMKVSIDGFKNLKPIAKKTRCNVKIVRKSGLPFYIFRYRKRKILVVGVILFIMTLYILSSRIWLINYSGLNRVQQSDIENFLKSQNLYTSAKKSQINKEKIKEDLVKNFDDIAWVNIDIKGTRVSITIKETIETKKVDVTDKPSNVVAKKDGIIESIVVSKGKALVKPLDVVKKGDMLITGELTVKEDEFGVIKNYVPSSGQVLAKTYYNFDFSIPYEFEEKVYTGNRLENKRIRIFSKNIDLYSKKIIFTNYNRVSTYKELNLGEDYPLPIIICTDIYSEFVPIVKTRTFEEAKELAIKVAENKILRDVAFDVNIVDKNIELSENKDGIKVHISITATENIAKTEELDTAQTEMTTN